ncbi:MAG: O-antigen ligase family protein, partial [bacterium]
MKREIFFWVLFFLSLGVIWRKPFWGVVFYAAINIIRLEMLVWGGTYISKAYFILFAVILFAAFLNSPKFRVKYALRPPLLFILWLYIALIVSIELSPFEMERAYYYANEIFKIFLFCFLITVLVNDDRKIKRFEDVLLLCIVLLGIWGIQQHFRGNTRLEGMGGHAWPDSNGVAAMFVLFFPLAVNKIVISKDFKTKLLGIVSTMVVVLLIIFTQSRGGFLALLVCSLYLILTAKKRVIIMLLAVFVILGAVPFIGKDFKNRMSTMGGMDSMDDSGKSRLILWQAGLMVFRDNLIFGTGFLSYPLAKMKYEGNFNYLDPEFRSAVFRIRRPKVTHNTYIQILSDGGLFAAVPLFLLILGTFWKNRVIRKKFPQIEVNQEMYAMLSAIEAGLIGFCVAIMFMDALTNVFFIVQIIICYNIRGII